MEAEKIKESKSPKCQVKQCLLPRSLNLTLIGLGLALALFISDQVTKILARNFVLDNGGYVEVFPFFNLVHVWNEGVSFGMMQAGTNEGVYLLIAVASVITALFLVILMKADHIVTAIGCGTIIGGSCGNILDRVQYGAVYDFLDFHIYENHWPAFNVADCCVVIGIAIIAYDSLFLSSKSEEKKS